MGQSFGTVLTCHDLLVGMFTNSENIIQLLKLLNSYVLKVLNNS